MFSGEGASKEDEFRFPQPAVSNTCFDLTVHLMSFGVIWNQRDQEKSLIVIPQPTNRHTLAIGLLCMAEIGFYLLELLVYLFRQIIHHTDLPGIWISTTQHKIMKFVSFEHTGEERNLNTGYICSNRVTSKNRNKFRTIDYLLKR